MMKSLVNQTNWNNNFIYSMCFNDTAYEIFVTYFDKKPNKKYIAEATFKTKMKIKQHIDTSISSLGYSPRIFDRWLSTAIGELLKANKKFVLKNLNIKMNYIRQMKSKFIYEIYMTDVLLSFIKKTDIISNKKYIVEILENLMHETNENKRKREEDIEELYNVCLEGFGDIDG